MNEKAKHLQGKILSRKEAPMSNLIQKISDLISILGIIDVPQGSRLLIGLLHPLFGQITSTCPTHLLHSCYWNNKVWKYPRNETPSDNTTRSKQYIRSEGKQKTSKSKCKQTGIVCTEIDRQGQMKSNMSNRLVPCMLKGIIIINRFGNFSEIYSLKYKCLITCFLVFLVVRWYSDIKHKINSIRDIEMQIGRANTRLPARTIGIIHLGTKIRFDKELRQSGGKVEDTRSVCVFWEW